MHAREGVGRVYEACGSVCTDASDLSAHTRPPPPASFRAPNVHASGLVNQRPHPFPQPPHSILLPPATCLVSSTPARSTMALQCSNCNRSHISALGAVADGRKVFCNVDCAWSYRFRLAAAIATRKASATAALAARQPQGVPIDASREPADGNGDRRRVTSAAVRTRVASAATDAIYMMHHPTVGCGQHLLN
eukprot:TRINITY_DN2376_c0_g1_i1.p1 TRINITY_DN2376_c0_g1~~TRINITY_DN2376_c0_g1_i1.p1  ORF type:complete len:192 (+),score=30.61 TRINITY_DN2376_c0_g1_i1:293-868(+)